jgi:hypothetical protein
MIFNGIIRLLFSLALLLLQGIGLVDYLKNIDENDCSMTYMFEAPSLIPVRLADHVQKRFPFYRFHLYCEGYDCELYHSLKFNKPGQIPVLFIPGNADSHMQVRSLASIALDKSRKSKNARVKFFYFTISFNEDLSALYGPLLNMQTDYVRHCIEHILKLFAGVEPAHKRPTSVVLIGNSMGGLVARGLFLPPTTKNVPDVSKLVHTIITQSTPHKRPVVRVDAELEAYYDRVNKRWLNNSERALDNVVLASLYGGVRDVLVRADLANVNEWKSKSTAAIVCSYTGSMPYVWRSIDHRCMAWCRELILAISRALFDLVEPNTEQIAESRQHRERILRGYFERDKLMGQSLSLSSPPLSSTDGIQYEVNSVEFIADVRMMHYEFAGFTNQTKIVAFDLSKLMEKAKYDSLFIYTNANSNINKAIVALCKNFTRLNALENRYECSSSMDLFAAYGRLMPPLLSGTNWRNHTLKIYNILDLDKRLDENKYSHLVLYLPVHPKKLDAHQLIVKFDWYLRSQRASLIELPIYSNLQLPIELSFDRSVENDALLGDSLIHWGRNQTIVYKRIYLPSFDRVWQAYSLQVCSAFELNSCDLYALNAAKSKQPIEKKPLASSSLFVLFYEPAYMQQSKQMNEHIYSTHVTQTKFVNLTLRLTKNQPNLFKETAVYVDLIKIDMKHLLHHSSLAHVEKLSENFIKCTQFKHKLIATPSYSASLGQLIRFYATYMPAFLVVLLQFYDYTNLKDAEKTNSDELESRFSANLFLHKSQTNHLRNFIFGFFLTTLVYLSQSNAITTLIESVDPNRSCFMKTDYDQLNSEDILFPLLPMVLFWCAYALLSLASFFLSILVFFVSFFIQKVLFKLFNFIETNLFSVFLLTAYFLLDIIALYYVSTLAFCFTFYAELIRVAAVNPNFSASVNEQNAPASNKSSFYSLRQSRLLFYFILMVLNLIELLVWTKSMQSTQLIQPLRDIIADCGVKFAIANLTIGFIFILKSKSSFLNNFMSLPINLLRKAILINAILAIFYATSHLYRLQYFILIHLFLLTLYSPKSPHLVIKSKRD